MKNIFWIVFALIILFLLFTRQGRNGLTQIIQQSGPINMDFGGTYEPGTYVLPDFQIPLVNGVSLPPPLSRLSDDAGCCCNSAPSGSISRPTVPFVSPSVLPGYTPPPASVSYRAPQEPDYLGYWNLYSDIRAHYPVAVRQPHFTRGAGKVEADINRDNRVSELEFARYHWLNFGQLENRTLPMKDR